MLSREKAPKKDKNAFAIERIPLLQVYFSHFIGKQGTIFKVFVLSKVLNFVLVVPPVIWFTMDLQTSHLEDRYHCVDYFIIIIIYFEVFLYFFPNQFFQKIVFFLPLFVRKSRGIYWKVFSYKWCSTRFS